MSKVPEVENKMTGKVKMDRSFHEKVEFLNPGDTFLLADKHWSAANKIVQSLADDGTARQGSKFVVAISGGSGAGKSEIGYCIGAYLGTLGLRSVCYSTDNCYKIEPNERGRLRKNAYQGGTLAAVIGPAEYDWDLIRRIEQAVLNGGTAETPVVDITKDSRPIVTQPIDYSKYDVLLLDGIYAIGGGAQIRVCVDQTWEGVIHAQKERGKETPDELRLAILKLELEAVNKLASEAKGKVFNIDISGNVAARS